VSRLVALLALCALCACRAPLERTLQAGDEAARAGKWEEARAAWAEAASLDEKSVAARVKLGIAQYELGRRDEAAATWTAALALDARSEAALEVLARLELERGDAGAALARLDAVKAPTLAGFHLTQARALLARGGPDDAARALAAAQKAAGLQPGELEVDYLIGCAQIGLKRFADAQGTLESLARRHPESPLGSYGLARLAAAQGRQTDTLLHLAAARTASGSGWNPALVAADPAFAFLTAAPEFQALLK
jgi:predicted Zn-dependent protease